jgi:hypothetical protein
MPKYWGYDQEEKARKNAGGVLVCLARIAASGGFIPGRTEKLLKKRRKIK